MDKKYIIYMHKNKINSKVYIGQTCQSPNRRWRNGNGYLRNQNGTHFANAIKKYGWDNFEHIILKTDLTKDEANYYETKYIKEFKSSDRNFGYNQTLGGEGMVATEEIRLKMSQNHADFKGENSPLYGKKMKDIMSEESYNLWLSKLREYGKTHTKGNSASAIRVYCVEKDTIYNSLTDASESCGISISSISSCIHGKKITAGVDKTTGRKLHWCRADEKDNFIIPIQPNKNKHRKDARRIYCVELDEDFYGAVSVSKKYNISSCHIIACCDKKRKSAGKHPVTGEILHWCYFDEKDTFIAPNISESKQFGKHHHAAKAVYCIELDEIFDTAVDAHNKYGFSKQHIGAVCRGQRNVTGEHPITHEKLHWLFLNDAISAGFVKKSGHY